MDVWIARDDDGYLGLYYLEPTYYQDCWIPYSGGGFRKIDQTLFQEVRPGEKRLARVTFDPKPTTLF